MTAALTREAIVETVARAQFAPATWDKLSAFGKSMAREQALPYVTATLAALMPLVEDLRDQAGDHTDYAKRYERKDETGRAMNAYGQSTGMLIGANTLLGVMKR